MELQSSPEFSIRPLQDESMAQHKREMCGVLNDLLQVEAKVAVRIRPILYTNIAFFRLRQSL